MTHSSLPVQAGCWYALRVVVFASALTCAATLSGSAAAAALDAQTAAIVADLQARIDALERRLAALERGRPPNDATVTAASAAESAAAAQPATTSDDMARALERALVREGGLLLPPAAVEIEPRWSYQHRSSRGLELLSIGGQPQLAQVERRSELQQAALGIRVGLPAQWQLDLLLPYASVRQRQTAIGSVSVADTVSGWGASEIGLNWQLRPVATGTGVIAALRWTEPGSSAFDHAAAVPLVSGFQSVQASVLFVTRHDPVVLVGALAYAMPRMRHIAGHTVDPGDIRSLRGSAIIALSPEISLRMGVDLSRAGSTRIDGVRNDASGGMSGEFSTGLSFALSPRLLLGIEAGIGLTPNSPDFRVGLSLPVRF